MGAVSTANANVAPTSSVSSETVTAIANPVSTSTSTSNPLPLPLPTATATAKATASSPLSLTGAPAPLPSSSAFSPGPLAAGLFLALLAAAALVMTRRRRRTTRLIDILESVSLGPKRALVVARLGDELLVLGSSEGGIALLSSRPAAGLVSESTRLAGAGRATGEPSAPGRDSAADGLRRELRRAGACPPQQDQEPGQAGPRPQPRDAKGRVLDLLSRLKARVRPPAAPQFDALLTESLEDVELRRKLAAGLAAQAGHPPTRRVAERGEAVR